MNNGERMSMTLLELNAMVREAIEEQLPEEYWVEAELSEVRETRGNCYMELIEKDEQSNVPIARASAKCWQRIWAVVRPYFERTTGERLHAGMKVMMKVYPQFHEAFGFSWIVSDIDPTYTLGDMARKRNEIIRTLKEEGVFDLNRELPMPLFAQRIAVISSETAAGYGDFCNQLADNEHGYRFTTRLFPATMQGEKVEESIIAALNRINDEVGEFDCVVIIRGGGATSDMSGFDTLALAENVANFPMPVITGIGHDRDESILDMVAHTKVKTPTAAAAFLIANLHIVDNRIDTLNKRINGAVALRIEREKHRLIIKEHAIVPCIQRIITAERHKIDMLEQRTKALNPDLLLLRGYSITLKGGKTIRSVADVHEGDEIETRTADGIFKSVVGICE